MGTKHVVPRAEGQGGIGTATLGWGELFITNTTNDSATQGGKLTLTSNDGDAMQSGSRLGVIEFKGAESSSALTIGARIEAICDAVWSATENGASLKFYTTDANASESLVLTLDSNKLAVFSGAVAITGNLTVNGTTTTVNSTIVTIDDPVFTLGGDTAPVSETTQDKGIEFRYHTGSAAKVGFFGWDDSASAFTFIPDATNNSEVFSGTAGNAIFTNITGTLQTAAQTNITSVGALNGGTITSGFGAINNGASTITTTGLISGGSLDIDNVLINGTTIGHTDDTDLMTLANGVLTVAGELNAVSLDISGNADIDGTLETDALSINGTAVTASAADINLIDGITNGTVIASKAIITDSNKDITGGRNITISGELDAATLDISGNVSIDGTLEAGAITVRPLAGGVQNATLELIGRAPGGFGGGLLAKSSIYSETSGSAYSANLVFKTNNASNSLTERLRLNYNGDAIFSGEIKAPEATFSGKLSVSQSGADMIDLTRSSVGTYRLAISSSDAFSIFDVGANADRFIISSGGAATFSGSVGVTTSLAADTLKATNANNASGLSFRSTLEAISGEGWATAHYHYNNNDGTLFLNRDTSNTARPVFHVGGYNNSSYHPTYSYSAGDAGMVTLVKPNGTKNDGQSHAYRALSNSGDYSNWIKDASATRFFDSDGKHEFNNNVDIKGILSVTNKITVVGGTAMTGGWARVLDVESNFPVISLYSSYSNTDRWAGIGYDNTTAMRFWVNSSTADISATTAVMSIKNNGNVGIGSDAPGSRLTVVGGASTFSYDDTTPAGTASSVYRDAVFGSTDTTNTGITIFGSGQTGISFGDAASHIRGQVRYQHSSDTLELGTSGNLYMSISSTGGITSSSDGGSSGAFFLAGTSSSAATGKVALGLRDGMIQFRNPGDYYHKMWYYDGVNISTNSAHGHFRVYGDSDNSLRSDNAENTLRLSIDTATGNIGTTEGGSNLHSNSDQRIKENILTLPSMLSKVKALRAVSFDWKYKSGETGIYGFIAQEVQEIDASLVFNNGDTCYRNDKTYGEDLELDGIIEDTLAINERKLIPILVKAIQEQQAIIEDLKSRIETLEG